MFLLVCDIDKLLKKTETVAKECGLLNRIECKVMIFDNKQKIDKINNIDVVEQILYLGILIRKKNGIAQIMKKLLRKQINYVIICS